MNLSATVQWLFDLQHPPCALRGGKVLFAAANAAEQSMLHTLTLDGRELWACTFENALIGGVETREVLETSRVLVSLSSADLLRGEGMVLALNADGQEMWRWPSGGQKVSAPAIATARAETSRLYLIVDTKTLVCLDATTGNEMQRWSLLMAASSAALLVTDDAIYIPCRGPQVLAYDLNGQLRWQFTHDDAATWLDQTPVVIADRLIVVSTRGEVLVLDRLSGALKQRIPIGPVGKPLGAPATDGARVFIGARDGLYALAAQTGVHPFDP